MPFPPQGAAIPPIETILEKSVSKLATIFESSPYVDVVAGVVSGFSTDLGASIFNHDNLSVSRAASIFDQSTLENEKAADIFNHPNLSDTKATQIWNSLTTGKKATVIGLFDRLFGNWTYEVIRAAYANAWEQVADYVYRGFYSGRLYGYSKNDSNSEHRDHRSKVYVMVKGVASKKLKVRSYEVNFASSSYGADYGLYAKFGDYAIYWSIAYATSEKTPTVAPNVTRRTATVSEIFWKTGVTDVTVAEAFSAAGYPVPTDADEVEIGVALIVTDGPSETNTGVGDIRFDAFEVV